MANLGRKGSIYVARFRHEGKEYKKSLKTSVMADAKAAMHSIERAIHGIATGMLNVPDGVDPGDFILSGGTLREADRPRRRVPALTVLITEYLANLGHKAPSTAYTEGVHLRNLIRYLGSRAGAPADRIAVRDLEQFLQARLKTRKPHTVKKERSTVGQFFKWAMSQGYLDSSPAADLTPIKECSEPAPFRTIIEIEAILARKGLTEAETDGIWDCLYLTRAEIAELLRTVRTRADTDFGYLLHAIPAYTGMRRGEVL